MNVCVLGGSGFVGTELVRRLVYAGYWVRVPTRNIAHAERLRVLDTAELRVANVHEPRVLSQLFAGCEAVINLIGILNPRGAATFETVHTVLAAKVMAAARGAGVRRVLHMSALGAGVLPLARARALFAPISVLDVAEAFVRALTRAQSAGATYELCGPAVLTLAQIVRLTAGVANLPCHIIPLPDVLARIQGMVMGLLPGKPFSLDNFRSLTLDSVCRENGCAALGITPRPLMSELPLYLASAPRAERRHS